MRLVAELGWLWKDQRGLNKGEELHLITLLVPIADMMSVA